MPRDDVKKSSKASKAKGEKTKRSPSAYIIFASEMRPTVKAENPDATFGELGKLLGAKWAALSDAEKAVTSFAPASNGFLISNTALPEEGRGRQSLSWSVHSNLSSAGAFCELFRDGLALPPVRTILSPETK